MHNEHNQNETINHNLVKVIGLSLLMIAMILAYVFRKGDLPAFGLPIDQLEKIDSTAQ